MVNDQMENAMTRSRQLEQENTENKWAEQNRQKRRYILGVLEKSGWRLADQGGAAEILGLKRTTLRSKMKKLGIRRPTG